MKKVNIIAYFMISVFSLLMIFLLIPKYSPPDLGDGMPSALLPKVLCGIMLICSSTLFCKELFSVSKKASTFSLEKLIHFGKFWFLLALSIPLLDYFGFIIGSMLELALLQFFTKQKHLSVFLGITFVLPLLLYVGLFYGLKTSLP